MSGSNAEYASGDDVADPSTNTIGLAGWLGEGEDTAASHTNAGSVAATAQQQTQQQRLNALRAEVTAREIARLERQIASMDAQDAAEGSQPSGSLPPGTTPTTGPLLGGIARTTLRPKVSKASALNVKPFKKGDNFDLYINRYFVPLTWANNMREGLNTPPTGSIMIEGPQDQHDPYLVEQAKAAFQALQLAFPDNKSLEAISEAGAADLALDKLRNIHMTINSETEEQAREKLKSRKQKPGESPRDYFMAKDRLRAEHDTFCTEGERLTDSKFLDFLISGVDKTDSNLGYMAMGLAYEQHRDNGTGPQEIEPLVEQWQKSYDRNGGSTRHDRSSKALAAMQKKIKALEKKTPNSNDKVKEKKKKTVCSYHKKKTGNDYYHDVSECRLKKEDDEAGDEEKSVDERKTRFSGLKECKECGKVGHLTAACPRIETGEKSFMSLMRLNEIEVAGDTIEERCNEKAFIGVASEVTTTEGTTTGGFQVWVHIAIVIIGVIVFGAGVIGLHLSVGRSGVTRAAPAELAMTSQLLVKDLWIADGGATSSQTPHESKFTAGTYVVEPEGSFVDVGGPLLAIAGRGTVTEIFYDEEDDTYTPFVMEGVLHVPGRDFNLCAERSVLGHLESTQPGQDHKIVKTYDYELIPNTTAGLPPVKFRSLPPELGHLWGARAVDINVREKSLAAINPDSNNGGGGSPSASEDINIFHRKVGHLSKTYLERLATKEGITLTGDLKPCTTCLVGKSTRPKIPKQTTLKATAPFERVHTDLQGPVRVRSLGGKLYTSAYVDQYSSKGWVYFIPNKTADATAPKLQHWLSEVVHREYESTVGCVRRDNGSEFLGSYDDVLSEHSIMVEPTTPDTPQHNAKVERRLALLWQRTLMCLWETEMPLHLWAEAMSYNNDTFNVTPHSGNPDWASPCDMLDEPNFPAVADLQPFGRAAAVRVDRDNKLGLHNRIMYFVGYAKQGSHDTYRFYDPTTKSIKARRPSAWLDNVTYKSSVPRHANGTHLGVARQDFIVDEEEVIVLERAPAAEAPVEQAQQPGPASPAEQQGLHPQQRDLPGPADVPAVKLEEIEGALNPVEGAEPDMGDEGNDEIGNSGDDSGGNDDGNDSDDNDNGGGSSTPRRSTACKTFCSLDPSRTERLVYIQSLVRHGLDTPSFRRPLTTSLKIDLPQVHRPRRPRLLHRPRTDWHAGWKLPTAVWAVPSATPSSPFLSTTTTSSSLSLHSSWRALPEIPLPWRKQWRHQSGRSGRRPWQLRWMVSTRWRRGRR